MTWSEQPPRDPRRSVDDELRSILGAAQPDFDVDALVAGTTARAGRIRRRQALARTAVAAVLVPTLAGTGWVVTQRLSVDAGPDAVVASQTSTDPAASTTDAPVTDDAATTELPGTAPDASPAPYQDPAALPELTEVSTNPDLPNREEIPDARPTGIPELDALGAPTGSIYPRAVALPGFVASRDIVGMDPDTGIEEHSGRTFDWLVGSADGPTSVELSLTLWDDAGHALEQLRTGGTELNTVWLGGETPEGRLPVGLPDLLPWPGHEGSADHLLVRSPIRDGQYGALLRQGDYLVGVAVVGDDPQASGDLAATIAEQTAANLVALDPAHASVTP